MRWFVCAAIVLTNTGQPLPTPPTEARHSVEIEAVFREGHRLFGNRLKAVSVSGEQITWHLHDSNPAQAAPPQLVTLTIQDKNRSDVHLATYTGTPIDLEYDGQQHELEFLPDAAGQVIAYGNDIHWHSASPSSPIVHVEYTDLQSQ